MNPKESNSDTKYRSLTKALKKEMSKPNPDKEVLLMLNSELKKIDSSVPWDSSGGGSYQNSLNLVKK